MIRRRLDRLSLACRSLLHTGAVIGERFDRELLARVSEGGDALPAVVDEAFAAGLLAEDETPGCYRLAHALLCGVLYGELLPTQRERLHARVAAALTDIPTALPEHIAHHTDRAGNHAAAAFWLEQAGDRAARMRASTEAALHYQAARTRLATLGSDEGAARANARLADKLGALHFLEGDYAQAQEEIARARALTDDPQERAALWCREGICCERQGAFDQALACFDQADVLLRDQVALRPAPQLAPLQVEIELARGEVYRGRGDGPAFERAVRRAAQIDQVLPGTAAARVAMALGQLAARRGDHSEPSYSTGGAWSCASSCSIARASPPVSTPWACSATIAARWTRPSAAIAAAWRCARRSATSGASLSPGANWACWPGDAVRTRRRRNASVAAW